MVSDLNVTVSVDAYYTPNVRENDASMLMFGAQVPGATNLLIPPSSLNHVALGQCSPSCTHYMLPREGINVFAAAMHTHATGKAARLHQYRDGREHPWILNDDNYNFEFQQVRILRVERKILPGDHMDVFMTRRQETEALSLGDSQVGMKFVSDWRIITRESRRYLLLDDGERVDTVITDPPQYANLTVSEYATNNIEWDLGLREEVQRQQKYQVHTSLCPNTVVVAAAQRNVSDAATAASSVSADGRERRGNSEEARAKDTRVERELRRYTGDGGAALRQPPVGNNAIVLQVSGRPVTNPNLGENEIVFPAEIPAYRRPPQCRHDFGLPSPFGFFR
ncbi:hypothetical protein Ocin01_19131, partial [Orchesella cincta]